MSDDIRRQATELFNSLPYDARAGKEGLGYSLAQLDTIISMRTSNREAFHAHDRKNAAWQKNIEQYIEKEFLGRTKAKSL